MKFSKNVSFLIINIVFCISYLIIVYPHIPTSGESYTIFIVLLLILNTIILMFPLKSRAIIMLILLGLVSLYFGMQTVYFRGFQQYGSITTALSIDRTMFKFTNSALELMRIDDVRYFVMPVFAFYIVWRMIKKDIIRENRLNQFTVLILSVVISYVQYSSLHKEMDTLLSNPIKISDKDVIYSNIPNINIFVENFGLNGLLFREFDTNVKIGRAHV